MLIDSHCHLDYFTEEEVEAVVLRARQAGVGRMVTIGTRVAQAAAVKSLTGRFDEVWGTVGIHPHNVAEHPLPSAEELAALADHPRIIGIGESGLDYFYDRAPRAVQMESFRRHIHAARAADLPLVIHARDADADILAILEEEHRSGGAFAFLLHCFSSGRALAERAVAMGGYVSFSGMLTFPKAEAIREIARDLPEDRLLVETDAPYLAPVPLRGKRCEPAHVVHTARMLAGLRGITQARVEEVTTANFFRLFRRAA
jgi:TatD DNase family protein